MRSDRSKLGKLADLVLWSPAFFGVKPATIVKGGMIVMAPMGDINASIPTPQPVHYRPMFGALGSARHHTRMTFISQAAFDNEVPTEAGPEKPDCGGKRLPDGEKGRHDPQRFAARYHRGCPDI